MNIVEKATISWALSKGGSKLVEKHLKEIVMGIYIQK